MKYVFVRLHAREGEESAVEKALREVTETPSRHNRSCPHNVGCGAKPRAANDAAPNAHFELLSIASVSKLNLFNMPL